MLSSRLAVPRAFFAFAQTQLAVEASDESARIVRNGAKSRSVPGRHSLGSVR